jgi:hypothetical protein
MDHSDLMLGVDTSTMKLHIEEMNTQPNKLTPIRILGNAT